MQNMQSISGIREGKVLVERERYVTNSNELFRCAVNKVLMAVMIANNRNG